MKLYVDINTGVVRRTLTGPVIPCVKLYVNDVLPLRIALVDSGVVVTSQYLTTGIDINAVVRGYPLNANQLATASGFSLDTEEAVGLLDLTEQALADYFTDNVPAGSPSWGFIMEIQVAAQDGSTRQTLAQQRLLIGRELVGAVTGTGGAAIVDEGGAAITDEGGNTLKTES